MEIKGFVKSVGQTVVVSEKFKKREIIVDVSDNPQYPSPVKFEAVQDKVSLFDNVSVGQNVELFFNLNGREWTDPKTSKVSYFTTLAVWRINILDGTATPPMQQAEYVPNIDEDDDSLPF